MVETVGIAVRLATAARAACQAMAEAAAHRAEVEATSVGAEVVAIRAVAEGILAAGAAIPAVVIANSNELP